MLQTVILMFSVQYSTQLFYHVRITLSSTGVQEKVVYKILFWSKITKMNLLSFVCTVNYGFAQRFYMSESGFILNIVMIKHNLHIGNFR